MKPVAALAVGVTALFAQTGRPVQHSVTAVRHWSLSGVTRFAVEVSGPFDYRTDRLHNPERVYYDILNARPKFDSKRLYNEDLKDPFAMRVRVAETTPGITRVVFDLKDGVQAGVSVLSNPDRLIVELKGNLPNTAPANPVPPRTVPASAPTATPTLAASSESVPTPVAPPVTASVVPTSAPDSPAANVAAAVKPASEAAAVPTPAPITPPPPGPVLGGPAPAVETPKTPKTETTKAAVAAVPLEVAKPAHHTSAGSTSLTRALGLKIQRVVIDPGHGGHDEGTQGSKGLVEKDLVLDVALRVGKLIEDRMGAEVIYTRSDDTFIPLEGRTALANDKKADLFLSIHANSSPITHVTGVETYYLNFTDSKDALDVASRENASSQKSVFELHDILQQISAHDKAEESRDFASRVQSALFAFSAKTFPDERNRGVRKAPFVVLIGANMPSVLAEIGFLSNAREEALLKKADYKQKLAEALFRGISKYADGLSHFQVAEN